MSYALLIQESQRRLTGTERRIAEYLQTHSYEVIHMNAKELAAICGTSPASVVRFARKLGYQGFPALKLDLAWESGKDEKVDFQTVLHDGDDMNTIIRKAEQIHLRNTALTFQMLNPDVLTQAVEFLANAKSIRLFGVGASGLLAMDFLYKASRIGYPAFYHSDVHTNIATASLMGEDDVALAISYSGETRETVLAAKAAKQCGSKVISITQANRNTLSRLADCPIYIPDEEREFRIGAMTSRSAGLLVLDLLFLGMAKHDPEKTDAELMRTRNLIRTFQGK